MINVDEKEIDQGLDFGTVLKFKDEQYGEIIGTIVGAFYHKKINFYYSVSVKKDKTDIIKDFEKDSKKYYYKFEGKEDDGVNYIFKVKLQDIIEIISRKQNDNEKSERKLFKNK